MFLDKFRMKCRNFGKDNQLLLFDILNYLVEQGNMNIWVPVSSKKFLTFILDILKSENDAEIQTKLLQLIQSWGMDFENKKDIIPNFFKIYNKFKVNGVVFPPREESNYYKYILREEPPKQNYNNRNNRDNFEDNKQNEYFEEEQNYNDSNGNDEFAYIETIKNKLKVSNFDHKYRRLVAYLVKMHDNIKLANIYIDKRRFNELKDPINTIKKGNQTIMDTISSGRLKDEKLMEITLGTTEDINQTLSREEEMKSGNRPNKFVSYFILNEIIPMKNNIKNNNRYKSEKKKFTLNQNNNYKNEKDNYQNNQNNNNIRNADDIFDLFSPNKPNQENGSLNNNNLFNNNNQNNNMMNDCFTNQNSNNNNFFNDNKNNNFVNNNINNYNSNNRRNNNMNSNDNNFNQNNFNNNRNNQMNNFDLLQGSINVNNQQNDNNFQNNNNQNKIYNPNEFDMYGPAPEINSNQLIHYIGPIDNNNNNNNNQYPSFDRGSQNNNLFSQNNQGNQNLGNNNMMGNNFGNNMNNNNPQQMTQEDIEREQRLKELDDLF